MTARYKELMFEDIVYCGSGSRIKSHSPVQKVDHNLGKHREHLFKSLLLSAFYAPQVLFGILIRKKFRLFDCRFAQSR
jgi:hypothetical protein